MITHSDRNANIYVLFKTTAYDYWKKQTSNWSQEDGLSTEHIVQLQLLSILLFKFCVHRLIWESWNNLYKTSLWAKIKEFTVRSELASKRQELQGAQVTQGCQHNTSCHMSARPCCLKPNQVVHCVDNRSTVKWVPVCLCVCVCIILHWCMLFCLGWFLF